MGQQPHNDIETINVQNMISEIPNKRYFKIGEVCEIAGVKQHVLRYWETEFKKLIRPQRASSKQRLYRRIDIENILTIKKLLKEEGFTIPGAKKLLDKLKEEPKLPGMAPEQQKVGAKEIVSQVKHELVALRDFLKKKLKKTHNVSGRSAVW